MGNGSIFGEIGLIFNCPRTATVRSKNYCIVEALHKEQFNILAKNHPKVLTKLKKKIFQYNDKWLAFMRNLFKIAIPYFSELEDNVMTELVLSLKKDIYPQNSIIVNYGEDYNSIYIVMEGEIDVLVKVGIQEL